ncbi:unnamed protein product [Schistosoma rodhaini]|uniref:EF-hand domain-containing protein n=1 Tax=Schistosoma rodhaini TaxID=6188 RepID=A0AA85FFP7_9TREM|nr:unnamed protein product [Schistosoma rodhaini]
MSQKRSTDLYKLGRETLSIEYWIVVVQTSIPEKLSVTLRYMEALKLSESEVNFYFSAFDSCDVEKSGKLPTECVRKFLSRFAISDVLINDIVQLSSPSPCGLWGRSGIPMSRNELIRNRESLPLPAYRDICVPLMENDVPTGEHSSHGPASAGDYSNVDKQFNGRISQKLRPKENQTTLNNSVLRDSAEESCFSSWPKCYDEEQSLLTEEIIKPDNSVSYDNENKTSRNSDWWIPNKSFRKGVHLNTDHSSSRSSGTITSQDSNSSTYYGSTIEDCKNIKKLRDTSVWSYRDLPDHSYDQLSEIQPKGSPTDHSLQNTDSQCTNSEDKYQFSLNSAKKSEVNKWRVSHCRSSSFPFSQYNNTYCNRNEKRKEKWLASFALQSKREAEYASQFDEFFISKDIGSVTNCHLVVTRSEVTQLFTAQYKISSVDFDNIWLTADINRDNYLDKAEFCLASHLAHLLGHRGLSLYDAVSACKPYISKITRKLRKYEAKGNQFDLPHLEYLCATGLLNNDSKYDSINNPLLKQHSAIDIFNKRNPIVLDDSSYSLNMDSAFGIFETNSKSLYYNSFENLSHGPVVSCDSCSKSSSSTGIVSSSSSSSSSSSNSSSSRLSASPFSSSEISGSIDSVHLSSEKTSTNNPYIDPIQLLSAITGHRKTFLSELSSSRRRRLLSSLIREAKSVNHTLLRLNNEMQGELAELNDQRVNLRAQLQHLGLQPAV